jgi:hypothetical protein
MRRLLRRPGAVAVAALLLSACGSGATGDGRPSADPTSAATAPDGTSPDITTSDPDTTVAVPETELLDALLDTRVDGRMPLDGALTAFAALYGGVPGVEPSTLAPDGLEGTTAARWLSPHHGELTSEQRAAVDAAMAPLDIDGSRLAGSGAVPLPSISLTPHGLRSTTDAGPAVRATGPVGERGCFGGAFPFADAPGAGKYKDFVGLALRELGQLMGPLDIPVFTAFSDFEGINADLNPWAPDCSQPAQACQIRLAPLALKMTDRTLVKTLAHELTHCYQARALGTTTIATMPDWLIEGFPSFVAETVGVSIGATVPNYWWDKWFKRPGIQLYGRTYDALGFYAVVQQAGGDPFGRYMSALTTMDSGAAFHELIGGVSDHFGTIWGATHFRDVERGLFWDLDGPGTTDYQPAIPTSTITNGGGYASAPDEAQAEADLFSLQADVVIVELTGPVMGRYSFAGQADEVISEPHEWCTLGYPCVCPDGSPRAGTVVDQAPATELAIGIAGIEAGGTFQVTGVTFDDYCGPNEPTTTPPSVPPAVDECLIGRWVSGSWTIPGPPGLDLDLAGGSGIAMAINREGLVTTDFSAMATMSGPIPQPQSGTATQEITAADGKADAVQTTTEMNVGPGVFAIWADSTRYDCGADSFTLINYDRVESVDIAIPFVRAG